MKKRNIIILIGVILIILIIIGYNINTNNNDDNDTNANISSDDDIIDVVIDFDNLDNAKIEDGKKINISEKVNTEQDVDYYYRDIETDEEKKITLTFDNISLYADSNMTYFSFTITNDNDYDISYVSVNVAFVDSDGNYIYSNERNLHDLTAHSSVNIEMNDYVDYTNAYTLEITAG